VEAVRLKLDLHPKVQATTAPQLAKITRSAPQLPPPLPVPLPLLLWCSYVLLKVVRLKAVLGTSPSACPYER
jgi:hypothetical protein